MIIQGTISSNRESKIGMSMSIALPFMAMFINGFNVDYVSPSALVIACRLALRCQCLAQNRFQTSPASPVGLLIGAVVSLPALQYTSRLDPSVQMICFVALAVLDLAVIGSHQLNLFRMQ